MVEHLPRQPKDKGSCPTPTSIFFYYCCTGFNREYMLLCMCLLTNLVFNIYIYIYIYIYI